jgi:hypothetical protein
VKRKIEHLIKEGVLMTYKVFISHANDTRDLDYVNQLEEWLRFIRVEPLLAKDVYAPTFVKEKVEKMIEAADSIIVVYTQAAEDSGFVQQEMAYSHSRGKPMFILKAPEAELTGFTYGYDVIDLGADDINKEFEKLSSAIESEMQQKQLGEILSGIAAIAAVLGFGFLITRGS